MRTRTDPRIAYRFVVPLALVLLAVAVVAWTPLGERPGAHEGSQVAVWVATLAVLAAAARLGQASRRLALLLIAVLAAASYLDYGRFHGGGRFVHDHEFYHHTVASRYFPELGYEGLYVATLRALEENDRATADAVTVVKNLRTYRLESAAVCRQRADGVLTAFTEARWQDFKRDVAFFQTRIPPQEWQLLLVDHGNNTTPFITALYASLTDAFGISDATLALLASLDLLLIALMLVLVYRTFGSETALLFAIFLFANVFAVFDITGGSFLRNLWLAGVVAFACAYGRRRMAVAGIALAIATLDRGFPVLLAALPLLQLLVGLWRERRVPSGPLRFAAGFCATIAVVGGLATAVAGGLAAWFDFYANTTAHQRWYYINQVSLRNLFIIDPTSAVGAAGAGWDESAWIRERMARDHATVFTLGAVRAVACVLLGALAAIERRAPVALGLLAFLPFVLLYPANYYHVVLCLAVLCWPSWPRLVLAVAATQAISASLAIAFPSPSDLEFVTWVVSLMLVAVLAAFLAARWAERCREEAATRRVVFALLAVGAIAVTGGVAADAARSPGDAAHVDASPADVVSLSGASAHSESMLAWGNGWSLNDQLVVLAGQPGARVGLRVPAPAEGRYRLKIDYTATPAFGVVALDVNGERLDGATDLYSPRVGIRPSLHDVQLREGDNELSFTVVGSDERATAAHVGIDRVVRLGAPGGGAPDREGALRHALDWVRAHPVDAFDGGTRGLCDEVVALAALASLPSFADEARRELHARAEALGALRAGHVAPAERDAVASAARAARRVGLDLSAPEAGPHPTAGWAAREHAERRLLAVIRGPVDLGRAPEVAATLFAVTSDVFALTDHGHEPAPRDGVLADRGFWAQLCDRGLHWATGTGDAFTTARMVLATHALGVTDDVPSLPRAVETLLALQEPDGSLGPAHPDRADPRRDGVLAAMLAWSADLIARPAH